MDRHFFSTSSEFLIDQLRNDIFSYIKENKLYSYELLYNAELDRTEDKMGLWEPYYGNSKNSSSQVFSRYKNDSKVLTDMQLKLISENMSKDTVELFLGLKKIRGINKDEILYIFENKFLFFFNKMLEDAFIMDRHYKKIIDVFTDYVPFAKYVSQKTSFKIQATEVRNQSWLDDFFSESKADSFTIKQEIDITKQGDRQKLLMDSMFVEIFWDATMRLLDKINLKLYDKFLEINNFESESARFFQGEKLLFKTNELISKYFDFIYNSGYLNCRYSIISEVSYGEILFNLLEDSNNIQFDESKSNYLEVPNRELFDSRCTFRNEVLRFSKILEKIQVEIDKEDKKELERLKKNNIKIFSEKENEWKEYVPRFTSPLIVQCFTCRFSNLINNEKLNKNVLNYYVSIDSFCRHCKANLEVEIKILDDLKLKFNVFNCNVIEKPNIYYFDKDY